MSLTPRQKMDEALDAQGADFGLALTYDEADALTVAWAIVAAVIVGDAASVVTLRRVMHERYISPAESLTEKMDSLCDQLGKGK